MNSFSRCLIFIPLIINLLIAQNEIPTAVFNLEARGVSKVEAAIITDRLRSELINTNCFFVMERELMEEILEEQAVQLTGVCSNTSCLVEVGKLIAVQQMVGGSIGRIGTLYTLQIRLVDVETGEVIRSVEEDYQGSIEMLLTSITPRVARKLAGLPVEEPFKFGIGNSDLFVDSQPAGAVIYINDQPTGKTTPATLAGLRSGNYKVYLKKENNIAQENVSLADGELKKIDLQLVKAQGRIRVLTTPAAAEVYYGSILMGMSPLNFEVGLKERNTPVSIIKKGYLTETMIPEFNEMFEYRVNKVLKKAGSIRILSQPEGAEVYISGQKQGMTPFSSDQIPFGQHLVEVRLNDYITEKVSVEISKTNPEVCKNLQLKKKTGNLSVIGKPAGARVKIDGRTYGQLPLDNISLEFGRYEIDVERPGYESQSDEIVLTADQTINYRVILAGKTTGRALWRSLLLPGWGQAYQEKGIQKWLYPLMFAGGLAGSYYTLNDYNKAVRNYNDIREQYLQAYDPANIERLRDKMDRTFKDIRSQEQMRDIAFMFTGAVWLWNVIDIYLLPPGYRQTMRLTSQLNSSNKLLSIQFFL
jgi:hypothetical protein